MGMTDLQFKSYLRLLIALIDEATSKDSKEEMLAQIKKLRDELERSLRG